MPLHYLLLVNKQGQTRLAKYYEYIEMEERVAMEGEIVRRCLARNNTQCSFFQFKKYRIIYRRYASLFFIIAADQTDNELAILEFIHNLVETFDKYFDNVCELDIMFNLERAHFLVDEMVMNGHIVEANKRNIMTPVELLDKTV